MGRLGPRVLAVLFQSTRFLLATFWPLFLIIIGISVVVATLGALGTVNLAFFGRISPLYVRGAIITLAATAVILPTSFIFGFLVGWARISENPLAYSASTFFVEALRGTPQLVVVLVGFFVILPIVAGGRNITSLAFWAGSIALALHSAAYQAEIFRNGFQSVPSGQIEAAHALGLDSWQTMRGVIFPQALRVSLPPLGNEFANVVKDSAILSFLGLLVIFGFESFDLVGWGQQIGTLAVLNATLNEAIFNWILIAIVYFVLIYILTASMLALERRMQVPGLEEAI
ncbi:MAG: amino acid ABC transporter permease [Candidatus Thermoplasmatota archaeon]|nr:amino acid ABC transporter permease [Candidatus Thermoplasmatota archaeon]